MNNQATFAFAPARAGDLNDVAGRACTITTMYNSDDFYLQAHQRPHHCRTNGGHLVIRMHDPVSDRRDLTIPQVHELVELSMAAEVALMATAERFGRQAVRVNHQDNGNWAYQIPVSEPHLHWHLYLRCTTETHPTGDPRFQAFPDALSFPPPGGSYYTDFAPLSPDEVAALGEHLDARITSHHPLLVQRRR